MFNIEDVYNKAEEYKLKDLYVGFKRDAALTGKLLLRLSCVHPEDGKTRIHTQILYDQFSWFMELDRQVRKLHLTTLQPLSEIKR